MRPRRVPTPLRRRVVAPLLVAGLVFGGALVGCSESSTPESAPTSTAPAAPAREAVVHDFVIPEGTAALIASGGTPDVIPARLDVHVGDSIRVRNDDTEVARLGIFDVGPGETMSMNFTEERVLSGVLFAKDPGGCGSPPAADETFIINVRP